MIEKEGQAGAVVANSVRHAHVPSYNAWAYNHHHEAVY